MVRAVNDSPYSVQISLPESKNKRKRSQRDAQEISVGLPADTWSSSASASKQSGDVPVQGVELDSLKWREGRKWLGERNFYHRKELEGTLTYIESMVSALSQEFDDLWNGYRDTFLPWKEDGVPVQGWELLGTHLLGTRLEVNCELAPCAASLAERLGATFCGYSVLQPGTHVPPHAEDSSSSATRVHVPLRVPRSSGCGLCVGGQVKVWVEGTCLAFDSTQEHEAWNFADEMRVVLLLDFGAERVPISQWPEWLTTDLVAAGLIDSPLCGAPEDEESLPNLREAAFGMQAAMLDEGI